MFYHQDVTDSHGAIVHTDDRELSEVELMRFLHQLGYFRAAIIAREECLPRLHLIEFLDVVQQPLGQDIHRKHHPLASETVQYSAQCSFLLSRRRSF